MQIAFPVVDAHPRKEKGLAKRSGFRSRAEQARGNDDRPFGFSDDSYPKAAEGIPSPPRKPNGFRPSRCRPVLFRGLRSRTTDPIRSIRARSPRSICPDRTDWVRCTRAEPSERDRSTSTWPNRSGFLGGLGIPRLLSDLESSETRKVFSSFPRLLRSGPEPRALRSPFLQGGALHRRLEKRFASQSLTRLRE